ncbi:hypothetical protein AAE478_005514 [Parahypoxylon ruwenzoriense]
MPRESKGVEDIGVPLPSNNGDTHEDGRWKMIILPTDDVEEWENIYTSEANPRHADDITQQPIEGGEWMWVGQMPAWRRMRQWNGVDDNYGYGYEYDVKSSGVSMDGSKYPGPADAALRACPTVHATGVARPLLRRTQGQGGAGKAAASATATTTTIITPGGGISAEAAGGEVGDGRGRGLVPPTGSYRAPRRAVRHPLLMPRREGRGNACGLSRSAHVA